MNAQTAANAQTAGVLLPGGEVNRIASDEVPWLAYPLIENSLFKILKVDEITNTVILKFRIGSHVTTPKHGHHCVATAYTLSGEWFYEDLEFRAGDIAYECTTDVHQPLTREKPAELLPHSSADAATTVCSRNTARTGDPTCCVPASSKPSKALRTRFFKALEGITQDQLARLDLAALLA
jgi:hypothetical protein